MLPAFILSANAFETTRPPLGLLGTALRCSVLFVELKAGEPGLAADSVEPVEAEPVLACRLASGVGVNAEGVDDKVDAAPPHPDSRIAVGTAITDMSLIKFMS